MSHLQHCMQIIHREMDAFVKQQENQNLYQPISYILSLGGKRLRPALCLLAAQSFGASPERAIKQALAIEIFHNFSLMHDDIMDNAPLRRGMPTVHEKWNTNSAILSGDAMLVQAYQLVAQSPAEALPQILSLFSKTAIEVCEGQQLDMEFETRNDVGVSEYLEMIRLKTSVLLAAALELGAIVGGANQKDAEAIYSFGENLGIAFQLRDDYLDVFGDSEKVGKQSGGDILADKKTFLLLKSIELAGKEQLKVLNQTIGNTEIEPNLKVETIRKIMLELKVDEALIQESETYFSIALKSLNSLSISNEYTLELKNFAEQLMVREH